jgi:hypothetical protein
MLYLCFKKPQKKGFADKSANPFLRLLIWSERHDSNVRPLPPQGSALAKLSYAPTTYLSIPSWYLKVKAKHSSNYKYIYLLKLAIYKTI